MINQRKRRFLFLAGLVLGLAVFAGGYALYTRVRSSAAPVFLPGSERPVGQSGPVGLRFAQPVDPASVEARLRFEPGVLGSWRWRGNTVWFDPRPAFNQKQAYTLSLDAGAQTASGQTLSGSRWTFTVRAPWLAYLSPADGGREVWRAAVDGSLPQQLTHTGGRVLDFSAARDGEMIYFTAANDAGGADVWSVERGGEKQTRLVNCGRKWCEGAAASPDNRRVAYSQKDGPQGKAAPYLYDLSAQADHPLYSDTLIQGEYFAWSSDGGKLALYDQTAGAVRVHDFTTERDTLFESNFPGAASWSPDGQKLIFLSEDREAGFTRVIIYQADLGKQDLQPLWEKVVGDDSGLPIWSPGGDEILFSQRILPGSSSRQLYVIHPDGSGLAKVTDDLRYTNAAYQWSPDGRMILFQRLAFGSSDNRPEIMLFDRSSRQLTVLAFNAAQPRWLP